MKNDPETTRQTCEWELTTLADDRARMRLAGAWNRHAQRPRPQTVLEMLRRSGTPKTLVFDAVELRQWDSTLLTFLLKLDEIAREDAIHIRGDGLPDGVRQLLRMATSAPDRGDEPAQVDDSFVSQVGMGCLDMCRGARDLLAFIGEATIAFARLLAGRARFRYVDVLEIVTDAGPRAVPIITLIAFLMGLILAFIGAMQLRMFGAQIYVADLVGIGIVREMGAIMTGVVMAGRTGAAFAAHLGTMQVNEEIDAFRTLGISPMEFLVLPRMLALAVMMPLLCLYADLMGILGGMLVGVSILDLGYVEYYNRTIEAVTIGDLTVGLVMGAVFGVLVALCGCLRGLQSGRNSAAVGLAATSAMVSSIVSIVVATALITVICDIIGV